MQSLAVKGQYCVYRNGLWGFNLTGNQKVVKVKEQRKGLENPSYTFCSVVAATEKKDNSTSHSEQTNTELDSNTQH